jgi:putative transposase
VFNRDYKEFAPGVFSHIYNRGDNKEIVFRDDQDYRAFLFRLGLALGFDKEDLNSSPLTYSPKSRIRITNSKSGQFKLHAFCLMPNHFHLLIEQLEETSISKLIQKVCTSFSRYINLKYKRVGHTFQDKFKAVNAKGNPQLMWTLAYIHMNPVKDGITANPQDYNWSSYNSYISSSVPFVTNDFMLETFGGIDNFIKQTENFRLSKTDFDTLTL